MDTIYMKTNFYNKLQNFFKNLATYTRFLTDEQYNELIKIQSTRISQRYLKCVCKSKCQNKKCICLKKKKFNALQNVTFLQNVIISKK
jgi:hypothetical protein